MFCFTSEKRRKPTQWRTLLRVHDFDKHVLFRESALRIHFFIYFITKIWWFVKKYPYIILLSLDDRLVSFVFTLNAFTHHFLTVREKTHEICTFLYHLRRSAKKYRFCFVNQEFWKNSIFLNCSREATFPSPFCFILNLVDFWKSQNHEISLFFHVGGLQNLVSLERHRFREIDEHFLWMGS